MCEKNYNNYIDMPVVPLRGLVVFPEMVLHFDVGRKKSIAAIKEAMKSGSEIFLVCQKDASVDDPSIDDIYDIGVVCSVKQMVKIPNSDNLRVVVKGRTRASIAAFVQSRPYLVGSVCVIDEEYESEDIEETAYCRALKRQFERYSSSRGYYDGDCGRVGG